MTIITRDREITLFMIRIGSAGKFSTMTIVTLIGRPGEGFFMARRTLNYRMCSCQWKRAGVLIGGLEPAPESGMVTLLAIIVKSQNHMIGINCSFQILGVA
jgi:hypothetical protein